MSETMRHRIALPVLTALMLVACGQAETPETESPQLQAVTEAPAPEASQSPSQSQGSEPEVGQRIEDTGSRAASDNSLAATAAREAERRAKLAARGIREIGWEDLMPEGEEERLAELFQQQMATLYAGGPIEEGSAADQMVQIGTFNTVPELNETKVRIPGYTVPFDFDAEAQISEFLLVPYFGACIHAPPPPPNQTIFVMTDEPLKLRDLAQAVWIEGTMYTQTQESELADAAYTIRLETLEKYEY